MHAFVNLLHSAVMLEDHRDQTDIILQAIAPVQWGDCVIILEQTINLFTHNYNLTS